MTFVASNMSGADPSLHAASSLDAAARPLVLHSDRFLRSILVSLLREMGFGEVTLARCADSALTAMQQHPPSMILTDWNDHEDAGEDRVRLVRRIRQSKGAHYRRTPVIMVSSPRSRRDIEMARDAGVTEFIITPIAPVTLHQRIRSLQEQPRDFVQSPRFVGPDRRRCRHRPPAPSRKRTADVEAGLTSPVSAARAAAVALVNETRETGDPLAVRVSRSLQRFVANLVDYTPDEAKVADMHRITLARLTRMAEEGNPLREPVVAGLEEVVSKRMRR